MLWDSPYDFHQNVSISQSNILQKLWPEIYSEDIKTHKMSSPASLLVLADADYVWSATVNHITPANSITAMMALLPSLL